MPVYRPKMAYKTTNVRYFDEAYQDFAPWEKYQHYHMSLSVGAKRAILGKYWQKELSKTLVRVRRRKIPAPLTLFSNRIRWDLFCEVHFTCDFCTALEILAFTLEEFVKGEKTAKGLVFDFINLI